MIIERIMSKANVNMNEVVKLEEAKKILEILKRHYPGIFDGLQIKYGDYYCYDERRHIVYIQDDLNWIEEELEHDYAIIDIVNEKYGLNLERNARCVSMHALLHELGHAADLTYKKVQGRYEEYMEIEENDRIVFDSKKQAYFKMRYEYEEMMEIVDFGRGYSHEERDEILKEAEELEVEMEQIARELDRDYREIITEAAADRFCVCLLKGMCKNII